MIYQNIPQPIQFFNAADQPYTNRDNCRGQLIHGLVFRNTHLAPFIVVRDPDPNDAFDLNIRRRDLMYGSSINVPDIEVVTVDGLDYIFSPAMVLPTAMPPGEYRYELTDGENVYYSEWFQLSPCTDDMTKVEYFDTCERVGIPWPVVPTGFRLHFWLDTHPGPSTVATDEEVEDDGKVERVTSVRTIARTSLTEVLPDHMLQVLHSLKHHKNLVITDRAMEYTDITVGVITGTVVARGCKQLMTMQFAMNGEWRKVCCEEEGSGSGASSECLVDDAEEVVMALVTEDETWFDANTSSDDEGLKLDTGSGFALVYVNGGFNYFPILGRFYMAALLDDGISTNVLYYITGTLVNQPTANLVNPEVDINTDTGIVTIGSQSFVTGRYARLEHTTDNGLNWIVDWVGLEEDLQMGVDGLDLRPLVWRVKYYTHGCDYGFSPVNILECCSEESLVISGAVTYPLANDTYPNTDSVNGKTLYQPTLGSKQVVWDLDNDRWVIQVADGCYVSPEDVEYPCQVEVWYPVANYDDPLGDPEEIRVCGGVVE